MPPVERSPGWQQLEREPQGTVVPAALAGAASLVALWPFSSVMQPGRWAFVATAIVLVVATSGVAARVVLRRRAAWERALWTPLAQLAVAACTLTALIAGTTALFGLIPTAATVRVFGVLTSQAGAEILNGSAPLAASPGLSVTMGASFAVLAVLLDQLIAYRAALLAGLVVVGVGVLPMIIAFEDANVLWFVVVGILFLVLFRSTALRDPDAPQRTSLLLAAGIGTAALVLSVAIAPVLPVSATWSGGGAASGVSVDPSLRLGDDLRRPVPVEVMTLATPAKTAPYLRLATLSRFDGQVWEPDETDDQALRAGFGDPEWGQEIAATEQRTSIRVLRMSSSALPVPFPATRIQGLSRAWRVMPANRTVISATSDASGRDYTVTSMQLAPTLEQIQAASATGFDDAEVPDDLPPVIARRAAEVTADADSDYDKLLALQTWFRGEFTYSLDTPVAEGFDGTGAEAVAQFLDVRSGYCIHFAGAFALMAQSLDMPVRIVVGYLPGSLTDQKRGEESIFSVTSDRLHSWPEVFFEGIGWVPFEPTASLGVPTRFAGAASAEEAAPAPQAPTATTAPENAPTSGPTVDPSDLGDASSGADELGRVDPLPVGASLVAVVVILLLPLLLRILRRRRRMRRARGGDALAAWEELRDTLLDLGLPLSDADSPRGRAAGLVRRRGVDADAMRVLTDAVEHASFARQDEHLGDLSRPLAEVLAQLRRSIDRSGRVRATLLPRSLIAARGSRAPLPN